MSDIAYLRAEAERIVMDVMRSTSSKTAGAAFRLALIVVLLLAAIAEQKTKPKAKTP